MSDIDTNEIRNQWSSDYEEGVQIRALCDALDEARAERDELDQVRAERDSARAALAIVARDAPRPRLESPDLKEARDTAADALLRVARLEDALTATQNSIEHWAATARQFCQNQELWRDRAEKAEAAIERVRDLCDRAAKPVILHGGMFSDGVVPVEILRAALDTWFKV